MQADDVPDALDVDALIRDLRSRRREPTPRSPDDCPTPLGAPDLHARYFDASRTNSAPNRRGVSIRSVTLEKMTDDDFYSRLSSMVGKQLAESDESPPLFPEISQGGRSLWLGPSVRWEKQPLGRRDQPQLMGLPMLPPGSTRYHLRAWVTDESTGHTWSALVCLFTLYQFLSGDLTGTVEYLDVIQSWIDALRRGAGALWIEGAEQGRRIDPKARRHPERDEEIVKRYDENKSVKQIRLYLADKYPGKRPPGDSRIYQILREHGRTSV